jgi:type II secretory pathway pseudopilin PulG
MSCVLTLGEKFPDVQGMSVGGILMRRSRIRDCRGVAAIELVVVASLVMLVVGMAVPIVNIQEEAQQRARVLGDLRQLAADMTNYRKHTGTWPQYFRFAHGDGTAAFCEDTCFGSDIQAVHISRFLVSNSPPVKNWRGPYMGVSRADAWGNRYVVVFQTGPSGARPYSWVLSAGLDQVFSTRPTDRALCGDDLGIRLR